METSSFVTNRFARCHSIDLQWLVWPRVHDSCAYYHVTHILGRTECDLGALWGGVPRGSHSFAAPGDPDTLGFNEGDIHAATRRSVVC